MLNIKFLLESTKLNVQTTELNFYDYLLYVQMTELNLYDHLYVQTTWIQIWRTTHCWKRRPMSIMNIPVRLQVHKWEEFLFGFT